MDTLKGRLTDKLIQAQKNALAMRPPVGGFPVLAEVLRQAGVQINRWTLPSCQSVYVMTEGAVVQQGTPLVSGTYTIPTFNTEALIAAIRADQAGRSTFPEFLNGAWQAGVVSYDVHFADRKVTYCGVNGETYIEDYPAVKI